jgi:hypothetical protein
MSTFGRSSSNKPYILTDFMPRVVQAWPLAMVPCICLSDQSNTFVGMGLSNFLASLCGEDGSRSDDVS